MPDDIDDIDAQAVRWLVRLRAPDATRGERQAHADWLAANREHELAFARLEHLWEDVGDLDSWARDELRKLERASRLRVRWLATVVGGLATAASLAVALVWWGSLPAQPGTTDIMRIVTEKAEQRRMALADGSQLHVNTESDIEVRFTANLREIVLNSGEGIFDVSFDPDRPFVVRADAHSVIALGTRFAVRLKRDGQWAITVIQGRVVVQRGSPKTAEAVSTMARHAISGAPDHGVVLETDQQLHIASGRMLGQRQTNAEEATAWQDGMLKFRQMPLRDAAREISRYTQREVLIAEGVPDYPVTGIVRIRSAQTMVANLAEVVPVAPVESGAGDGDIVLVDARKSRQEDHLVRPSGPAASTPVGPSDQDPAAKADDGLRLD